MTSDKLYDKYERCVESVVLRRLGGREYPTVGITIPKSIRDHAGIREGDVFVLESDAKHKGRLVVEIKRGRA